MKLHSWNNVNEKCACVKGERCVFPTCSVCFCLSSLLQVRRKHCGFINEHNKDKAGQVSPVHRSQLRRHMTRSHVTAQSPLKSITGFLPHCKDMRVWLIGNSFAIGKKNKITFVSFIINYLCLICLHECWLMQIYHYFYLMLPCIYCLQNPNEQWTGIPFNNTAFRHFMGFFFSFPCLGAFYFTTLKGAFQWFQESVPLKSI